MTIREFFETITVEEIGTTILAFAAGYVAMGALILLAFWFFFIRD